jgi:hypothetical protein
MCAARKLLFIAVLISIFTVGAARAELEVNRINSKNGSGASIAQGTFEALENRGKVSIKTKSLESQIVTQLKDRFKARVTDAGAKELAVKIADLIVTQFRKNVGAELWNADNRQAMTVTAIVDLKDNRKAAPFNDLVQYFKAEYLVDISPIRILLMDGMPKGLRGLALGRKLGENSFDVEAPLTIADEPIKIAGKLEIENYNVFLDTVNEEVYQSKDVLFLDSRLYRSLPKAAMATAAHEVRHIIDGWNNSPSIDLKTKQERALKLSLENEKKQMLEQDALDYGNSPDLKKYMAAIEAFNIKKAPDLRGTPELAKFINEGRAKVVSLCKQRTVEAFLDHEIEFETRGWTEQFRYHRIENQLNKNDSVRLETYEVPAALLTLEERTKVVVIDGKSYFLLIHPAYPYFLRFFGSTYDRAINKVPESKGPDPDKK